MKSIGITLAPSEFPMEGLGVISCKALLCQIDPAVSTHLKEEMKRLGWSIDSCDGLLEMLRLLDNRDYDYVILKLSPRNVEIHTRLGAIRAIDKHPKIVLNVSEPEGFVPSSLMLEYPVIKGALTSDKLINATRNAS